jgi:hypothetical protein
MLDALAGRSIKVQQLSGIKKAVIPVAIKRESDYEPEL